MIVITLLVTIACGVGMINSTFNIYIAELKKPFPIQSIKFGNKFSGGRSNPYILSVNVSGPVETDLQQEALFVAISMTLQ